MKFVDITKLKEAVYSAGQMLVQERHMAVKTHKNEGFDFGVVQDKKSEQILMSTLLSLDEKINIVSEESPEINNDSKLTAYIDPLDGSVNYSHGMRDYAVSISIFESNEPYMAFVCVPEYNQFYYANINTGVWLNGIKQKNPIHDDRNPIVNLEWFGATDYIDIAIQLKKNNVLIRTIGSSVVSSINLVAGKVDGIVLTQNKSWDVAAGLVFAECMGLTSTDFMNKGVNLKQGSINTLIASESLHNIIISSFEN